MTYTDAHRGVQYSVQRVLACIFAGGVTPSQASHVRLLRQLTLSPHNVLHLVHMSVSNALLFILFERATALVMRLRRREAIHENHAESNPPHVHRPRRRSVRATFTCYSVSQLDSVTASRQQRFFLKKKRRPVWC
jgi:hypothetical protein